MGASLHLKVDLLLNLRKERVLINKPATEKYARSRANLQACLIYNGTKLTFIPMGMQVFMLMFFSPNDVNNI